MKKRFAILALAGLSLNANAGFFDELNKVLVTTNSVLGVVSGTPTTTSSSSSYPSAVQAVPLAQITPAQEQRISQVIKANTSDKFVNQAILEAKPNLEGFLKLSSCQNSGGALMAGKYLSPSVSSYVVNSTIRTVVPDTKYHPLNQCMTVQSIGNWHIFERDTLIFNVVYASDVSSESVNREMWMKREPDGQWLVTKHGW